MDFAGDKRGGREAGGREGQGGASEKKALSYAMIFMSRRRMGIFQERHVRVILLHQQLLPIKSCLGFEAAKLFEHNVNLLLRCMCACVAHGLLFAIYH